MTDNEKEKEEEKAPNFGEMLNVIANTYLLYNSRNILGKHIDYNLEQNNVSKMNEFRQRSSFHELDNEMRTKYEEACSLDKLLLRYKATSLFFCDNFKRSFTIDLHHPEADNYEKKKKQIFALFDYAYSEGDKEEQWNSLSFLGKKQEYCLDFYNEDCIKRNISLSILWLLMLELIPTYTSNKGGAKDTIGDYRLLINFLREYSRQSNVWLSDAPILTRYENELDEAIEKKKDNNEDPENAICRLDMIMNTDMFFSVFNGYSSFGNISDLNREIKDITPDIDGIWVESEIPGTNFWHIQEAENGYFLHQYKRVMRNDRAVLIHARYECRIMNDHGEAIAFITHPSFFRELVHHQAGNNYKTWESAKFMKTDTKYFPIEKVNNKITKIEFTPTINIGNWFTVNNLYRILDEKTYKKQIEDLNIEEENPADYYELNNSLCAISQHYIFVKTEEKLPLNGKYLRVPKELNEALYKIRINDAVGICHFAASGELFLSIPGSMIFYDITTETDRAKLGIDVCNEIEIES